LGFSSEVATKEGHQRHAFLRLEITNDV
jgi:hypothetical protein